MKYKNLVFIFLLNALVVSCTHRTMNKNHLKKQCSILDEDIYIKYFRYNVLSVQTKYSTDISFLKINNYNSSDKERLGKAILAFEAALDEFNLKKKRYDKSLDDLTQTCYISSLKRKEIERDYEIFNESKDIVLKQNSKLLEIIDDDVKRKELVSSLNYTYKDEGVILSVTDIYSALGSINVNIKIAAVSNKKIIKLNPFKPFSYANEQGGVSWSEYLSGLIVADNFGNMYEVTGKFKESQRLQPGEYTNFIISFEKPVKTATKLKILIDTGTLENKKIVTLHIDLTQIHPYLSK